MNNNNLRITLKSALDNLWSRITNILGTVNGRIDNLEVNEITGITFNGTAAPKDAQGNISLQESDPNVPAWAKQQKAKTSDFTNDGDGTDNNSPFATEAYVATNGGKIDEVQVNGTPLPIVNKVVDVPVPTKTSDLVNDSGFSNMETLHMTSSAWSYVDYIFSELASELSPYEIRPFIASNATISAITNNQISPSLWGFVYTWRDQWHNYRFAGVDNVNGDMYIIEVHTDQAHYEQNIVYVDEIYKIDGGGGGGGGGGGSINGIYFNNTLIGIDTEGYVHLNETDPTVPAWAKAQTKPAYTAQEVGALPNSTTAADIGAVAKSGDTMNGMLTVNDNSYSNGGFVRFWKDGEGGNIVIASSNGIEFQIDASNNNRIRCFAYDDNVPRNYKAVEFNRLTGALSAPAFSGPLTGNVTGNCSGSSGSCASDNLTNIAFEWSGSYTTGSYMLIYNGETGAKGGALYKAINRANTAAWVDNEHKWVRTGGDTMTGPLKWGSGTALPAASSLQYFLGIDPFADGGTTHYITAANLLAAIGAAKADSELYTAIGNIVKSYSDAGTTVGYGMAFVSIRGKTVTVEFEAQITTAGSVSNVYDIGISVERLRTLNSSVPAFNVSDGIIHYFKSTGEINTNLEGYAGVGRAITNQQRWEFARVYNTSGAIGSWSDTIYTSGTRIMGTLYGSLT